MYMHVYLSIKLHIQCTCTCNNLDQRSVQGLQPVVTQNQQLQFTVPVVTCRTWTSRQEEGREWEGDEGERGRGREEGRENERERGSRRKRC